VPDNVGYTPGTGASVAADDVGGVLYQRIKPTFGDDGAATDVSATNPLPVGDGGGSLTVDGTLATTSAYVEYTGSVTSNNADIVAAVDVRAYKSWSLQLSGTFAATVQVQGSNDNSTWYALPLYPLNSATPSLATSLNATGINGGPVTTRYIRVRTTAYTSGTVTGTFELTANPSPLLSSYITVTPSSGAMNVTSAGTQSTTDATSNQAGFFASTLSVYPFAYNGSTWDRQRSATAASNTTGTGLPGVAGMYFDGTNYQRVAPSAGLPIAGAYTELTGSASANSTDLVASTDVRAYKSWSLQLAGTFSATVRVQGSNDNSNWQDIVGMQLGTTSPSYTTTFGTTNIWIGPVVTRYIRVRTTSYTSGTATGTFELTANPSPLLSSYVGNTLTTSVTGNVSTLVSNNGAAPSDWLSNSSANILQTANMSYVGDDSHGTTRWVRQRTPQIFKTVTATSSGNTAVWTPATGKFFRIMRYRIEVTNSATQSSAGDIDIKFQDATTDIGIANSLYVPNAIDAGTGSYSTGWIDLGNGILSTSANNVLNLNLSAALTAGKVRVLVCGIEE
jgi:hypothetical protein